VYFEAFTHIKAHDSFTLGIIFDSRFDLSGFFAPRSSAVNLDIDARES
jgi:hypothetical protein